MAQAHIRDQAQYDKGWATGVEAWLMDPCALPDEDDTQAYQRIREACWSSNMNAPSDFWQGFLEGIQQEFGADI